LEHLGTEPIIEVGGKTYKLSRFTRGILRQFMDWAEKQLGDPLDAIKHKLDGFSPAIQELLVRDAVNASKHRRNIQSPEIQALMQTEEGGIRLLTLLFNKHHPELTEAQVGELFDQCLIEHGQDYFANKLAEASGVIPDDEATLKKTS
jgi:hypothetical protein